MFNFFNINFDSDFLKSDILSNSKKNKKKEVKKTVMNKFEDTKESFVESMNKKTMLNSNVSCSSHSKNNFNISADKIEENVLLHNKENEEIFLCDSTSFNAANCTILEEKIKSLSISDFKESTDCFKKIVTSENATPKKHTDVGFDFLDDFTENLLISDLKYLQNSEIHGKEKPRVQKVDKKFIELNSLPLEKIYNISKNLLENINLSNNKNNNANFNKMSSSNDDICQNSEANSADKFCQNTAADVNLNNSGNETRNFSDKSNLTDTFDEKNALNYSISKHVNIHQTDKKKSANNNLTNDIKAYSKENELQKILSSNIINIDLLKKLTWGGIPEKYRAKCWRVFLGLSNLNNDTYENSLKEKNDKYHAMLLDLNICKQTKHQIDIDIVRLESKQRIMPDGSDISNIFINILSLYATQRPAVGYIQGMADILAVFLYVFYTDKGYEAYAESSAFFGFSKFVDNLQDNYANCQSGIKRSMKYMNGIVENIEPKLIRHMMNVGLEIHMFAFRWLNCFYTREFDAESVFIIFDTMFSTKNRDLNRQDFATFGLFIGVSLLMSLKDDIMKSDLCGCMQILQATGRKLDQKALQIILARAYIHENYFGKKFMSFK
ncbi:hypothetical protein EDEG_01181 [Edhazardia aedis USNM 41457]|uniref:Rab-GAP TBC domain-containing protein n=1 Tax=Edhazardia aedis (strain USNM 41457) TaxID=1003232 RepID=J9DTJ8_EDHAE|nr:hypothetical protein EDEG_01181 [Edhazardia aedis USNM 41457]|eukprot:EJW04597.1 hypothetical protein EDEG_01181 [Edhazardia aedis USNM 41457]